MHKKFIEKFKNDIKETQTQDANLSFQVNPQKITEMCQFLKENNYRSLLNLTASDQKDKFRIIYSFLNIKKDKRINLFTEISRENPEIESIAKMFHPADWYEREVYDLFGIKFNNHPDLRRIMLPDDWQGYPLRKDYQDKDVIKLKFTYKILV